MPRPPRIQYADAWHHATNRGVDHCTTFVTDQDRRAFLYLLSEFSSRFGVETHAYCLMGNHYHLLLRTLQANLSVAMQRLDGLYTQGFNRRHGRDGPLFRGRFASQLIESEVYLARAARYVHRNPLKPALVTDLDRYRWSSYPAYVGRVPVPGWLCTGPVLESFDTVASFRGFVEDTEDVEFTRLCENGGPVLGAPAFVERVSALADKGSASNEVSVSRRRTVEEIESLVAAEFRVSLASLQVSIRGQQNVARMAAMSLSNRYGGLTLGQLADRYGLASSVGAASAIRRLGQASRADPSVSAGVSALVAKLDAT